MRTRVVVEQATLDSGNMTIYRVGSAHKEVL